MTGASLTASGRVPKITATRAGSDLDGCPTRLPRSFMNALCGGALAFLEEVYSADQALFPFTTRLHNGTYENTYAPARTIRCTINCLLGMTEAVMHHPEPPFLKSVDRLTSDFIRQHEDDVVDPGDLGLFVATLSDERHDRAALTRMFQKEQVLAADEAQVARLNVQDLSWLLWGALAAFGAGADGAEATARRLFDTLRSYFVHPNAVLPRHERILGRRMFVSFGATV